MCGSCYKVRLAGETVKANYSTNNMLLKTYLIEGNSTGWTTGTTHHLKISVTPTKTGPFTFYVKTVAAAVNWASNWAPSSSLGTRDQQNERVSSYSISVPVASGSSISVNVSPQTVTLGAATTISGSIASQISGNKSGTVYLQYSTDNINWNNIGTTPSDYSGLYSYSWKPSSTGTLNIRTYWNGNYWYSSSTSPTKQLTVNKPTTTTITLTFQGYDYDNKGEVTILVNNQIVATLPTSDSPQNAKVFVSFSLDISKYIVSGANTITFRQNMYSSGVQSVQVKRLSSTIYSNNTYYSMWTGGKPTVTYKFNAP